MCFQDFLEIMTFSEILNIKKNCEICSRLYYIDTIYSSDLTLHSVGKGLKQEENTITRIQVLWHEKSAI